MAAFGGYPAHLPAALFGKHRSQQRDLEHLSWGTTRHDIHTRGGEGAFIRRQRVVAVNGKDQVVTLSLPGEIFSGVVDHMVSPQGAGLLHIARAAHGSHLGAEGFGDLHGEGPHPAGCAVDQHLLPRPYLTFIAQTLQGGDARHG